MILTKEKPFQLSGAEIREYREMGRHMEEEMVGNLFCTAKSHCASATG